MDTVCATGLAPDRPLSPRDGRGSDYAQFTPFKEVFVCKKRVEEVTGIEPAFPGWEPGALTDRRYLRDVLPLRYRRSGPSATVGGISKARDGGQADPPPRLVAVNNGTVRRVSSLTYR